MKNQQIVKNAINSLLNNYRDIKNFQYFYYESDKEAVVLEMINTALIEFKPMFEKIKDMDDVPTNIQCDLLAYENWLITLLKIYSVDLEIEVIKFKCFYEVGQQDGNDCLYLNREDKIPFMTLLD